MSRGLFISQRSSRDGYPKGGVQVCTEEYIAVIEAAGIQLSFCLLDLDRRLSTRLLRRFGLSSYRRPVEPDAHRKIAAAVAGCDPDFVFLNQVTLCALAAPIRRHAARDLKIVALSHGLESTDLLHFARLRRRLPLGGSSRWMPASAIGTALLTEHLLHADVDLVCALSPFDVELARWLGARRVSWLPRIVEPAPLEWQPRGERLGFVGTLDHAPNLEGLVEVLERLAAVDRRCVVRIVSASAAVGRWLASRFQAADYLGPLSDADLRAEAATWNAFIHPIFCYPRGCSTKLATPIGWHVPVITTSAGQRGYELGSGRFVLADEPAEFAAACLRLLDLDAAREARCEVIKVADSSPGLHDNAQRLRAFLAQ